MALCVCGTAQAAGRSYSYSVEHPTHGTIGTYTEEFEDNTGGMRVNQRMRIAVRVLGIAIYREDTDRTEIWAAGRLQSMESITQRNGRRIEVRGESKPDSFVITTAAGAQSAPKDISPTDAWALKRVGKALVFSQRTGRIYPVDITGGGVESLTVQGRPVPVRHFRVNTETQPDKWEAWLDADGVPVKFRSIEDGETIDFILVSPGP